MGYKGELGVHSLIMHDYYSKLEFWSAIVACEGFGAKPLSRIGFGGERFHPS